MNEDWRRDAACRGKSTNAWFPVEGRKDDGAEAIAVCRLCPVREECLEFAQTNRLDEGIYGGLRADQRRKLRREQQRRVLRTGDRTLQPMGGRVRR